MPSCLTPPRFLTEFQYGSTRAVEKFALFVIGLSKIDLRRLCGSPSALWADDWNSCAFLFFLERTKGNGSVFGILRDDWKREIAIDNKEIEITVMVYFLRSILFKL